MKILVIGNGFDLASGLKTSFANFFEDILENKEEQFRKIDSIIEKEYEQVVSREKDANERHYNINNGLRESTFRYDIKNLQEQIEMDVNELKDKINIWDIYFWKIKGEKIKNWSNVEQKLKEVVNKIAYLGNPEMLKIKSEDAIRKLLPEYIDVHESGKSNVGNVKLNIENKNDRLTIIYRMLFEISDKYKKENSLYTNLLLELEKFEKEFKNYLKKVRKSEKYKNEECFKKIIENRKSDEYYILNFNYTNIQERVKERDFKINENNVHGKYDKLTIFGIDQQNISATEEKYIFTKTYRKMTNQSSMNSLPLPRFQSVNEIIFYGHSLEEADYSYFQSVFDHYKLYGSNIKITFLYSWYEGKEDYSKITANVMKSITCLLEKYGDSMDNQDHGKNLLHKLLLENRILVKRIEINEKEK